MNAQFAKTVNPANQNMPTPEFTTFLSAQVNFRMMKKLNQKRKRSTTIRMACPRIEQGTPWFNLVTSQQFLGMFQYTNRPCIT
jgi:hypothetical protein